MLPLLERCEANVVHPVVGGLPQLPLSRWAALAALLAAARANDVGHDAFSVNPMDVYQLRFAPPPDPDPVGV